MTEKRIKELMRGFHLGWTSKHFEDTEALIRTVAAEARKEGIEEMRDRLLIGWPTNIYLSVNQAEWIKEEAERLKEKP